MESCFSVQSSFNEFIVQHICKTNVFCDLLESESIRHFKGWWIKVPEIFLSGPDCWTKLLTNSTSPRATLVAQSKLTLVNTLTILFLGQEE